MKKELNKIKMKKEFKNIKMNLQLFNGLFGPSGPPEGLNNPLFEEEKEIDPMELLSDAIETPEETPQVEPESGGGLGEIKDYLDNILQRLDTKETPQVENTPEPERELTEEEIEQMNNDFYLKFTEKPLEALQSLIDEKANEKVKPLQEYVNNVKKVNEWNERIQQFTSQNPDFPDLIEDITEYIQNDPGIRSSNDPLDVAYRLAKAKHLENELAETKKPIEEIFKDKANIEKILSNQELKSLFIQELKNGRNVPEIMGGGGDNITVTPSDKPKSIRDASRAWLNQK